MCLSCGCGRPTDAHGDIRHITLLGIQGAAEASGLEPQEVAANIAHGLLSVKHPAKKASDAHMQVIKMGEQQFTLGLAYPANRPDKYRGADGYRDFVSAEVLEKAAWSYLDTSREITLFHKEGTDGHGRVVESYIYRGPKWQIVSPVDGSKVAIKEGDWLLGAIWDSIGWDLVKSQIVNGWSPEGSAERGLPSAEDLAILRR